MTQNADLQLHVQHKDRELAQKVYSMQHNTEHSQCWLLQLPGDIFYCRMRKLRGRSRHIEKS